MRQTSECFSPQSQHPLIEGPNYEYLASWKFGQILALATWAPVVFQFICTFICRCFFYPRPPLVNCLARISFPMLTTDCAPGGIEGVLEKNLPSGLTVDQVDRSLGNRRIRDRMGRSKDPLIPGYTSAEPSLNREAEIEMGIMAPDTQYRARLPPTTGFGR